MKGLYLFFIVILCRNYCFSQSPIGEGKLENGITNQKLKNWQIEIANKKNKSILDYYLLLPEKLLEGGTGIVDDSREYRLIKANNEKHPIQGRINLKAGYLIASPDAYLKMALFKDRKNNKDIIGIILGCGMPPVQYCDYGFLEFNNEKLEWTINRDVFPWEDFNAKCNKLAKQKPSTEEYFLPEIILPEFGASIVVIDSWDTNNTPLFKINWNGEKFVIE